MTGFEVEKLNSMKQLKCYSQTQSFIKESKYARDHSGKLSNSSNARHYERATLELAELLKHTFKRLWTRQLWYH